MRKKRRHILLTLMGGILIIPALTSAPAFSQDFPNKPLTIYCGFTAGATSDLSTRSLADEAQKILGVPVVVENKPGGGATVAAALVASKSPDGYILGVISSSAIDTRHLMMTLAYDPFKDFTYLLSYARYIGGICVKKDSPYKTVQDLLEAARKNPGALSYSSSGTGGKQQLAVEFLAKQAGVKFKHVPFKGGAPATTALIGGHVDFTAGAGIHRTYVQQGVFRMLAITISEERDPEFPDIPTLKDLGYKDVPASTYLLVGPKGIPDPVFKKLESGFRQAAYSKPFQNVLKNLGIPFYFRDRKQLEGEIPEHYKFFDQLLKEIGVARKRK